MVHTLQWNHGTHDTHLLASSEEEKGRGGGGGRGYSKRVDLDDISRLMQQVNALGICRLHLYMDLNIKFIYVQTTGLNNVQIYSRKKGLLRAYKHIKYEGGGGGREQK